MYRKQQREVNEYSKTFSTGVIAEWEAAIEAWEADPSRPDPYEEVETSECVRCPSDTSLTLP